MEEQELNPGISEQREPVGNMPEATPLRHTSRSEMIRRAALQTFLSRSQNRAISFPDTRMELYAASLSLGQFRFVGAGVSSDELSAILRNQSRSDQRIDKLETALAEQQSWIDHGIRPALSKASMLLEISTTAGSPHSVPALRHEWHSRLSDAMDSIADVEHNFEDLRDRLAAYTAFQTRLSSMLQDVKTSSMRELRHAVLTLYDASHSVYSENLTHGQVLGMRRALQRLHEAQIDREAVRQVDRDLRQAGFETVPSDTTRP